MIYGSAAEAKIFILAFQRCVTQVNLPLSLNFKGQVAKIRTWKMVLNRTLFHILIPVWLCPSLLSHFKLSFCY